MRGDVERREMAQVPGEHRQVVDARRRGDGDVGKAGPVAVGARPVYQQPRETRRGYVERHHPVTVEVNNDIEPFVETVGPRKAARPPQPGKSVGDLGHGAVDRNSSSERASSQSASAPARAWRSGDPIERTFVST